MLAKLKNLSSTTKILIAVLGIPVLIGVSAFGYWTIAPLFYDNVVNESLDDAIRDASENDASTASEQTAENDQANNAPSNTSMETTAESMKGELQSGVQILRTGNFVDADAFHMAIGTANLIDIGDGGIVLRFEEGFETTNGPDLYVWLANDVDPGSSYVDLGVLKGNIGAQNYPVPEGTDLSEFDKVLIWCKAFSVLFGSAELAGAN